MVTSYEPRLVRLEEGVEPDAAEHGSCGVRDGGLDVALQRDAAREPGHAERGPGEGWGRARARLGPGLGLGLVLGPGLGRVLGPGLGLVPRLGLGPG